MENKDYSLLTLEEELSSVEEDALEDEKNKVSENYSLLEEEKKAVRVPYPDVGAYDTALDHWDRGDLQYKKGRNQKAWDQIEAIERYLKCGNLFVGHCLMESGINYYIIDHPSLPSRSMIGGKPIRFINVDDKNYTSYIKTWRYPSEDAHVSYSRNIHMHNRKVDSVDVILDRTQRLVSDVTDSFLRKALLRNKNKMRIESIIQTIQEKQDRIRMLPVNRSFIVQGCAGSGKTMVLLHRLRYLLFNAELEPKEYYFVVPTRKFKRFINDICKQFHIDINNVVPIQNYYQLLAGERKIDDSDEVSELVFPPEYLQDVYSREFIQEAYRQLIHSVVEQADVLTASCDATLSGMLQEKKDELTDRITRKKSNALTQAAKAVERVLPFIKSRFKEYEDIPSVLEEIQSAYSAAEQQYEQFQENDISDIQIPESRILENPRLKQLQEEVKSAEELVQKASIFTSIARKRKLDAIKQQYDSVYNQTAAAIAEEEKERRQAQATAAQVVYDGIMLEDVKEIIANLSSIVNDAQTVVRETTSELENAEQIIMQEHEEKIELLNKVIEEFPEIDEECAEAVANLEPAVAVILRYLQEGSALYNGFYSLCPQKEQRRLINHCKLFKGRTENENRTYLYQQLLVICKRMIRTKYDVKLNKIYKHYWYINLYCQYLTKGVFLPPRTNLFIDEAQDLSRAEIEFIRKVNIRRDNDGTPVFPVMNLFGDVNQTITLHGITAWKDIDFIQDVFPLDENFRNTNQIIDFCNRVFPFKMEKVGVDMTNVSEFQSMPDFLYRLLKKVDGTVFVVKDDYERKDLIDLLSAHDMLDYELYTVKEVKGLEFRRVCVFDTEMTIPEKYVAYTRALTELIVIHNLPRNENNHVSMIVAGDDAEENDEE